MTRTRTPGPVPAMPPRVIARRTNVPVGRVRDAIDTAIQLEELPATAAAVQTGQLSGRAAKMIAETATANPAAERELLATAPQGLRALNQACVAARNAVEDSKTRA